MYNRRREFWQMVAIAGIFSRLTPAQAATAADAMVKEHDQREPAWDAEERADEERRNASK